VTLGRRLTLLSALAVGATVVLACAAAYVATRGELRGQIDESLRAQARALQLRVGIAPTGPPPLPGEPPPRGGLASGFAQLVRPDGSVDRLRGGDDVRIPVTDADVAAAIEPDRAPFLSDRRGDGVHLRVMTVPVPGAGSVVLARSLEGVDAVLDRLRLALILLCAVGTALAAALGRLFSRRILKPVADLAQGKVWATEDVEAWMKVHRRDLDEPED
jgi:hypothetical protein